MKKVISILLAIVLVVGIGVGISAAVIYNKPENVAFGAIQGAIEDLLERDEIAPVWNMLHEGSLEVSVDKIKSDSHDVLNGGKIGGKIYFSADAFMLENINVSFGDVKVKGDIYASSDMLYVSESEIFDGKFGIVYKDAAKDLEESIFAYGADSDYAIQDKEMYDTIVEILKALGDTDSEKLQKDAEELAKEHIENIWKIICENVEFESDNEEVKLNGEREKVRVITIKIDGEAMANIVKDIYEYLCEDESIGDFLEEHGSAFMVVSSSIKGSDSESIAELYEQYLEDMEDRIDDICDEIEESADDIEIRIMTPKMSHKLLKAEIEVDGEEAFVIDFGKDGVKDTNEITIEVYGEELSYVISENTKDSYKAKLEADGTDIMKVSIDKKGESYTLSFGDGYYTIKGGYVEDKDTTTFTVKKIVIGSGDSEYTYDADITIKIAEKDEIPAAPEDFDRISDITEENIEKWIENIGNLFS